MNLEGKMLGNRYEIIEKIEAVNAESIRHTAQEIFSSNPNYTLLGNYKNFMDYETLKKTLQS